MVSWRQEARPASSSAEVCDITEHGDIGTHASVLVIHSTEAIKDEAIWDGSSSKDEEQNAQGVQQSRAGVWALLKQN